MKRISLLLFFIVCTLCAQAHVKFYGVELTGDKDSFVSQLKSKGFRYISQSATKTSLEGVYKKLPCTVIVYSYSKNIDLVYKLEVITKAYTQWDDLEEEFERLEEEIIDLYGDPTSQAKSILSPFEDEDQQMKAISLGCYNYYSEWKNIDSAIIRIGIKTNGSIEIRLTDRQSENTGKKMQRVSVEDAVESTKQKIGSFFDNL